MMNDEPDTVTCRYCRETAVLLDMCPKHLEVHIENLVTNRDKVLRIAKRLSADIDLMRTEFNDRLILTTRYTTSLENENADLRKQLQLMQSQEMERVKAIEQRNPESIIDMVSEVKNLAYMMGRGQ
jgi:DNA-directed RNA polymerase alpha subunit